MTGEGLTTFAYAKINLGLAIVARQDNGYHELESIMQTIELHDVVHVKRIDQDEIKCICGEISGSQNLAYKAAQLFFDALGQRFGLEIRIEKRIPRQAGLAGGSADAAAVLRLLNEMTGYPYSIQELTSIGALCGADVPFCLTGGTMWAAGKGEHLEPMPQAPVMNLVLAKPKHGVDTAEAYRAFDKGGHFSRLDREAWVKALGRRDISAIAKLLHNDLEQASMAMVPEIKTIKEIMFKSGTIGALMSGSGSTVFGIVQNGEQAHYIANRLKEKGFPLTWTTRTWPVLGELS